MKMSAGSTDVLNDLIEICVDGQKGFEAAAKVVDDPTIKDELVGYSWQRQQFATELRSRMKAFGEEPGQHGSVSGALHRGWMDVKSAFGASSGHSMDQPQFRTGSLRSRACSETSSMGVLSYNTDCSRPTGGLASRIIVRRLT